MYRIDLTASVRKKIQKLPTKVAARALAEIDSLAADPWPHGVTKLEGYVNEYRVRIGDYRIRYTVEKKVLLITVVDVAHRSEAYKRR